MHGEGAVLLGVVAGQRVAVGLGGGRAHRDVGHQQHVGARTADAAGVQHVVDLGEGVRADPLVQLPLRGHQAVAHLRRQAVEVAGVVRGEVLQPELGVLHRRERGGAGQPAHPPAGLGCAAQQVEEHLGAGLAGADHGDVLRPGQIG